MRKVFKKYYKKYLLNHGLKIEAYIIRFERVGSDGFHDFRVLKVLDNICAYSKGEIMSIGEQSIREFCTPLTEDEYMLEML